MMRVYLYSLDFLQLFVIVVAFEAVHAKFLFMPASIFYFSSSSLPLLGHFYTSCVWL